MRYLFIVTEKYSANGICVNAVMQKLISDGHQVECISNREFGEEKSFYKDGIQYWGVKPRCVYSISSRSVNSKESKLVKRILCIVSFLLNKIQLLLSIPTWPVISRSYSKRIYSIAKRLYEENPFDFIIPTYTQIDTIIATINIKKEHPEVFFVPYFLDSLAGGYGPKMFSREWVEKRGLKWENKLLRTADLVVMMQSSRDFYNRHKNKLSYFGKIKFLDIPLFAPKRNGSFYRKKNTNKKHIIYVGSIPAHIRNPQFFLEVFTSLKRDDIDLTIIGPSTCESLLNDFCLHDNRIERIQYVSHEEALRRIDNADILLNLGNNITTMMPSKIFEYMSSGKPIISTAPIKKEPCIPYLKNYEYAHIVDENSPVSVEAARLDDFISNAKMVDPNKLKNVFYLNTAEAFVATINNLK